MTRENPSADLMPVSPVFDMVQAMLRLTAVVLHAHPNVRVEMLGGNVNRFGRVYPHFLLVFWVVVGAGGDLEDVFLVLRHGDECIGTEVGVSGVRRL